MKKIYQMLAMALVVALLLTGCSLPDFEQIMEDVYALITLGTAVSFEEMEYARPDVEAFQEQLEECIAQAKTETKARRLMDAVYGVYESYYDFYTNYNLANIHYCLDMTDIYWDEEYSWCLEKSAQMDAGLDQLLYALADSPLKEDLETDAFFGEGFFDNYAGDSIWDETFTALANEESALLDQYYELSAQAAEVEYYSEAYFNGCGLQMEEIFVKLIAVRQEMAEYAGYESYPAFAYDFYYLRDYTPQQAMGYTDQIRQELVPLYQQLDGTLWDALYEGVTQEEVYAYTQSCAQAVGGVAQDAFTLLEAAGLYDITYSENKYNASFECFLYTYYVPFVFVCPSGTARDKLTFTHEFGHFCSDYASGGSVAGVDVAEIFSQGLEYLSLVYCEDSEALTKAKMADSLCTFVEQSGYASFEHQVYALEGEDLTVENVRAIYQESLDDFGMGGYGRDCRDYTMIPHFFIAPVYVISYVVSNDAAMQIYQAELTESGAGLALWEDNLATVEGFFLAFLENAGLKSPFAEGRVPELKKTFEEVLK